MPQRRSLLGDRLRALLTTEWVDAEDLMEKAIPLVPPGKALRRYSALAKRFDIEREERAARGGKLLPRRPTPPQSEQIRMGARSIVNDILAALRNSRTIDIRTEPGRVRYFRLSPERRFAHHCCMHGGSCRDDGSANAPPPEFPPAADDGPDPLDALVDELLENRALREAPVPPHTPLRYLDGPTAVEIDRLLQEVG